MPQVIRRLGEKELARGRRFFGGGDDNASNSEDTKDSDATHVVSLEEALEEFERISVGVEVEACFDGMHLRRVRGPRARDPNARGGCAAVPRFAVHP